MQVGAKARRPSTKQWFDSLFKGSTKKLCNYMLPLGADAKMMQNTRHLAKYWKLVKSWMYRFAVFHAFRCKQVANEGGSTQTKVCDQSCCWNLLKTICGLSFCCFPNFMLQMAHKRKKKETNKGMWSDLDVKQFAVFVFAGFQTCQMQTGPTRRRTEAYEALTAILRLAKKYCKLMLDPRAWCA